MEQLDKLKDNQFAVAGAAGLFFILTFLPYVTVSVKSTFGGGGSASVSAWHSYAILGILLVFIGVIAHYTQEQIRGLLPSPTFPLARVIWIVVGVGTLLVAIRAFTASASYSGGGVSASSSPGWGGILLIICGIVITVVLARIAESQSSVA